MGKMSVFGLVAFFWCFILVLGNDDNGLLLRSDVYRTTCPNHAPSVEEYLLQDVPVKTKIQCVALCQRNESCSAVTFADGLCSLMTSGEEGCEQRESGQGGLERVTSSWCSHGGEHVSEEECNCPEEYDGKFCTKVANTTQDGELELSVEMPGMYQMGEWDTCPDRCPNGSYAAGMQLEIEPSGQSDDTAVNVIRLLCRDAALDKWVGGITSFAKGWGEPWEEIHCPSDYWIVQFRLQYKPDQRAGDDSAVNGVEALCSGPGSEGRDSNMTLSQVETGFAVFWLSVSPWSEVCPPGSAVCGLATKVLEWQGNDGDDVAVADARMTCCPFPPL